VVRACRRIQEGQEITFSYIQLGIANLSREERKERLANWFPACGCEVCAREDDGVRAELGDLHKEMRLLTREGRVREAAGVALQKVKAMEVVREEVVMELPWAWMDYCELLCVLAAQGKEEESDARAAEEAREQARQLVTTFGDSAVHRWEKKCLRIAKLSGTSERSSRSKELSKIVSCI